MYVSLLYFQVLSRYEFELMGLLDSGLFLVPNVQRIVYSTCSIHATENERVVGNALKSEEASKGWFELAPQSEVLSTWPRRGYPAELESPGMKL